MKISILGQGGDAMRKLVDPLLGDGPEETDTVLLCDHAESDIPLGHLFTEIKDVDGLLRYKGEMILVSVTQSFLLSFDQIPSGHKTVCRFTFPDGIPHCITCLPKIDSWVHTRTPLMAI